MKKLFFIALACLFSISAANAQYDGSGSKFQGRTCTVQGANGQLMINRLSVVDNKKVALNIMSDAHDNSLFKLAVTLEVAYSTEWKGYDGKINHSERRESITVYFNERVNASQTAYFEEGFTIPTGGGTVTKIHSIKVTNCEFLKGTKCE